MSGRAGWFGAASGPVSRPAGHGCANVALLFKQLVQLVASLRACSQEAASWEPRRPNRGRIHIGSHDHGQGLARSQDLPRAHALQVHLGAPQLLPAVVPVALALGRRQKSPVSSKTSLTRGAPAYLGQLAPAGRPGWWGSCKFGGEWEGTKRRAEGREECKEGVPQKEG